MQLIYHVCVAVCSCTWGPSDDGSPSCIFPSGFGYVMDGEPEATDTGYQIKLLKNGNSKLFEDGLERLILFVEFHSVNTLRVRVSTCICFSKGPCYPSDKNKRSQLILFRLVKFFCLA